MSAHLPPASDEKRSQRGNGETKRAELQRDPSTSRALETTDRMGHQGNTIVNTTLQRSAPILP